MGRVNSWLSVGGWLIAILSMTSLSLAATGGASDAAVNLGPYNVTFLEGGIGLARPLAAGSNAVLAAVSWSMTGWMSAVRLQPGEVIVAAVGDSAGGPGADGWRGIYLADGELRASWGPGATLRSGTTLQPGRWYAVAATYDGTFARLYVDGKERAKERAATTAVDPRIELAPETVHDPAMPPRHFGGSLAQFTLTPFAQTSQEILSLARAQPQFAS